MAALVRGFSMMGPDDRIMLRKPSLDRDAPSGLAGPPFAGKALAAGACGFQGAARSPLLLIQLVDDGNGAGAARSAAGLRNDFHRGLIF